MPKEAFVPPDVTDTGFEDELPQEGNTKRPKGARRGSVDQPDVKGSKASAKAGAVDGVESQGSAQTATGPHAGPNAGAAKKKNDGAMMAMQTPKGSSGNKNADMGALIQQIKDKRDGLVHDTERDRKDQVLLKEQIERLQFNSEIVEDRLERRREVEAQYDKTLKVTNLAYERLMSTAANLQSALEG